MQTRDLTPKLFRFRSPLAVATGTLLVLFAADAIAQTSRSRPQPPQPSPSSNHGSGTDSHSTPSGKSDGSSGSGTSVPTTSGGGDRPVGQSSAVSSHGKVDFGKLFPAEKRSVIKGETSPKRLPDFVVLTGGIFDNAVFAPTPSDPKDAKSDPDAPGSDAHDTGPVVTVTVNGAYDRYKSSQEARTVSHGSHSTAGSQILWPYSDISPFWGYSPDDVFWHPDNGSDAYPLPDVFFPGPDDGVILGWPNYEAPDSAAPQADPPRDEPGPDYRIKEEATPAPSIDIAPALGAVYRAFLEEQPMLLAFHLQRGSLMALDTPGKTRGWVRSDLLLNRLTALFAVRHTISLEYEEPRPLEGGRVAVRAWYTYRNAAGIVYRAPVRFVLQRRNDRLIMTLFTLG